MKALFRNAIIFVLVLCTVTSLCVFSSASAETTLLKSDSLYLMENNYIYDVTVETKLDQFCSNFNQTLSVHKENGEYATDTDIISTGCYFTSNGENYYVIVTGDIDGTGSVDSTDYLKIKNYFSSAITLTDAQFKAADIDNSGEIDATDYLNIKSAFLGIQLLRCSKEYTNRKALVSQLLNAAEALSLSDAFDATITSTAKTGTETVNINGTFVSDKINTETPDFSFKLDAYSDGITYPIAETYYCGKVLYTQNKGIKYMTQAAYSEVSSYLSNYVTASPVDPEGNFILSPYIDKKKILGSDYAKISSAIKDFKLSSDNGESVYTFSTENLLRIGLFYKLFLDATGSENFEDLNIRDIFDSIYIDGAFKVNSNNVLYDITLCINTVIKDSAIEQIGAGTPKNMTVDINISFGNIGGKITVNAPDDSQYTYIDNIYTQFAFSAYDNVFGIASAVSSTYKETLTFGNTSASSEAVTNAKNVECGVELYRETNTEINGTSNNSKLYIGNLKYVTETDGVVTSMDLNTESLDVGDTGNFFTPHFESICDITLLDTFVLTENDDSYTLNYTLTNDYAVSLLKNSDLAKVSSIKKLLSTYADSQYTVTSTSGSITFSKITHDVMNNAVEINFALSDGNTLTYTYDFTVDTTNYDSVVVDSSLLK